MTDTTEQRAQGDFGRGLHKLCGAKKKRSDGFCGQPAMKGKARCRFHGGKSTGRRTAEGKERFRRAVTKHGLTAAAGNPLNIELYGSDAPGPRWQGHASGRALTRTIEKLSGAMDELEKLEK